MEPVLIAKWAFGVISISGVIITCLGLCYLVFRGWTDDMEEIFRDEEQEQ